MKQLTLLLGILFPYLLTACGNTSCWIDSVWIDSASNIVIHGYGYDSETNNHINREEKSVFPFEESTINTEVSLLIKVVDSCAQTIPYTGFSGGEWKVVRNHKRNKALYDRLRPIIPESYFTWGAAYFKAVSNLQLQEFELTLFAADSTIAYPDSFDLFINFGATWHAYGKPELLSYRKGTWKITPHFRQHRFTCRKMYRLEEIVTYSFLHNPTLEDTLKKKLIHSKPFSADMYSLLDQIEKARIADSIYVASPRYKDSLKIVHLSQPKDLWMIDTLEWLKELDTLRLLCAKYDMDTALHWARTQEEHLSVKATVDTTMALSLYRFLYTHSRTTQKSNRQSMKDRHYYFEKLESLLLETNTPSLDTLYLEHLEWLGNAPTWLAVCQKRERYLYNRDNHTELVKLYEEALPYTRMHRNFKQHRLYKKKMKLLKSSNKEKLHLLYTRE